MDKLKIIVDKLSAQITWIWRNAGFNKDYKFWMNPCRYNLRTEYFTRVWHGSTTSIQHQRHLSLYISHILTQASDSIPRISSMFPLSNSFVRITRTVYLSVSLSVYVCPSVLCVCMCLSVCLSISLSVCLSVCLSVYISVCLSVCLSVLCVCMCDFAGWMTVYMSICLPIYLFVYLSICLPIYVSVHLSAYLSVCPSICLPIYLSVCLPIYLSVHLSAYLSVCPPNCLSVWPICRYAVNTILGYDRLTMFYQNP